MDDAPEDPGNRAGQPDPAEIGDRRMAADRGERTLVAIVEGWGRRLLAHKTGDHLSDILTLLFGDRREARQRLARWPSDEGGIADDEDLRVTRH